MKTITFFTSARFCAPTPAWAIAALLGALALPALAQNTAPEVARVNGKPVATTSFEQALQDQLRQGATDSPALREAVRRDLVVQAVLVDLAEKAQLDQSAEVRQRLASARSALLAQAWQQQWLSANAPTEAEITAEYNSAKERAGNKEYQIRQVVLADEANAKQVMEQIKGGKSLADMARNHSIEPLGKDDGGLLPWVTAGALQPPLGEAVTKAKLGQLLPEPVRTANGFHILQVLAERPFTFPALDTVRPQIAQAVAQRKLLAAVQAQVNAATIELK